MELINWKIALAIALVIWIGFLWLSWKYFFKLFKHLILIMLIGSTFAGVYLYRMLPPAHNPNIGKHAYSNDTGRYLGVVEGSGDDSRRGEVWIVRPPGRYPLTYSKSRVTLKNRREIDKEPKETPATLSTPSPKPVKRPNR